MPRARRVTLALLAALALVTSAPASPVGAASSGETRERALVNVERRDRDRAPLRLHAKLSKIARKHSRRMANRGEIYHNPNLAKQLGGMRWRVAAENVGVGQNLGDPSASVEVVHEAFMDSAPHRENILRPRFRKVGVGVIAAGDRVWVTVVFLG